MLLIVKVLRYLVLRTEEAVRIQPKPPFAKMLDPLFSKRDTSFLSAKETFYTEHIHSPPMRPPYFQFTPNPSFTPPNLFTYHTAFSLSYPLHHSNHSILCISLGITHRAHTHIRDNS